MKTIKVNWSQYHKLVHKLALEIKKNCKCELCSGTGKYQHSGILKYKAIYSPENPMLAFLLSQELGIKLLDSLILYLYTDGRETKQSEVLIVSDIINTGKTREQYKDFDFACLYRRLIYSKDFLLASAVISIKELDNNVQVVMPWEIK